MGEHVAYREHDAGPALAASVECFWSSSAPAASGAHLVLPDGCMDLLFDFRAEQRGPATVIGTMSRPLVVESGGPSDLFGIRFRAGALPAMLGVDAAELRDCDADLGCFASLLARELWQRLAEAPAAERPRIARQWLQPQPGDPLVACCVQRIQASRGTVGLAALEAMTGAGGRRIERAFARHVGIGPKAFARIVRFRQLLAAAERGEGGWAQLAADAGYADQPHMARDFRALAGVSPTEYFAGRAVGFVQDRLVAAA